MSQENVAKTLAFIAAYNRRDFDAAVEFFDPEIDWVLPPLQRSDSCRGPEEIRRFWKGLDETFDELRLDPQETVDGGDRVAVRLRYYGRGKGSGAELETEMYHQVTTFREGVMVRIEYFTDWAQALEGAQLLERDGYPAGVPCWVDTGQPDPEAAVSFYEGLFGWQFEDSMPADAPGRYFVGRLRGRTVAAVGSQPEGMPPAPVWNTYVWVDSADEAAAKARDAGGKALMEPFDVADAGRMAVLADPQGAAFCVWQAKESKGAQLVNEPGTWNSSELNTRDLEGARAFYGAVFGWEAVTVDMGGSDFTWWSLAGYGDYLAQRDPDLRDRLEDDSAPPGFEDAVAWVVPMTGDQPAGDPPAHWSVTFAVDDADAIADRAAQLGGKVVVPPFDAPYVRMTVLSDPQGAVFTASKYMPPG